MNEDPNLDPGSAAARALEHYPLLAEVGRGRMASVLLALAPTIDGGFTKVAIKQVHTELVQDDEFRAIFTDEVRLAAQLHHPNVVETFDLHVDPECCFLVQEFLDGQPLSRIRQRARQGQAFPLSIHLRVVADVLAGLHYVHELTDDQGNAFGIVHRDATPSNIFVTYEGQVKVGDFGIAKAAIHCTETRMGVLERKLPYMSPEEAREEPIDRRSDIFSVGIMLWEAATGRSFWEDHDDNAIYERLATGALPSCALSSQIPNPELLRIITRALAIDPTQRYPTAAEMQSAIAHLLFKLGKSASGPALQVYMETFFAVEREKFHQIVDSGFARLGSTPNFPDRPIPEESIPSRPETPATLVSTFPALTTNYDVEPDSQVPERPSRGRPAIYLAAVAAAGCVVGAAFVLYAPWRASGAAAEIHAPPPSALSVMAPPVSAEPAVAPASASAEIAVVLRARPATARFFLDGEPLQGNPVALRRKPDDRVHRIDVSASGYVPAHGAVDLRRDLTREFDLARTVPRPHPVPTASVSPPTNEDKEGFDPLPTSRKSKRPLDPEDPWRP